MKNIFTYLTVVAVMLLVSCSSDSIVADGEMILEEGTMATKPSLECGDASRSALFLKDGKIFAHRAVDDIRETEGKSVDAYFREVFKC